MYLFHISLWCFGVTGIQIPHRVSQQASADLQIWLAEEAATAAAGRRHHPVYKQPTDKPSEVAAQDAVKFSDEEDLCVGSCQQTAVRAATAQQASDTDQWYLRPSTAAQR